LEVEEDEVAADIKAAAAVVDEEEEAAVEEEAPNHASNSVVTLPREHALEGTNATLPTL